MWGTLVLFVLFLPVALIIQKGLSDSTKQSQQPPLPFYTPDGPIERRPAPQQGPSWGQGVPRPSWGQVGGVVGGAWAIHSMVQDHRYSEHLGQQINNAQDHAYHGEHAFGSLEYYQDESDYLHRHL
jgi:hypothetical protein